MSDQVPSSQPLYGEALLHAAELVRSASAEEKKFSPLEGLASELRRRHARGNARRLKERLECVQAAHDDGGGRA